MPDPTFPPTLHTQDTVIRSVASELQGMGGFLRCRNCGDARELGSVSMKLRDGWPRCCSQTMEWITQRQINEGYLDDPEGWIARSSAQPSARSVRGTEHE